MNKIIYQSLLKLRQKKLPTPELDLKILLKHASLTSKEIILSNLTDNDFNINYFKYLLNKRLNNEPIAKIIKRKYFWKSKFFVNYNVLDPRPESELIIEEVLRNIDDKNKNLKILDIGTGSGCLAISLAMEFPRSKITAIDVSPKALEVSKINVNFYNLSDQIDLKLIDLKDIKEKYDVIISNPPYLTEEEYTASQEEIKKYEPKIALVGGKDGLKFYKLFAKKISKILKNNSIFVCEIGHNQLNSCLKIFQDSNLILRKTSKDIQKYNRTLTFSKI